MRSCRGHGRLPSFALGLDGARRPSPHERATLSPLYRQTISAIFNSWLLIRSLTIRMLSAVLRARCAEWFAFLGTSRFLTVMQFWRRLRRVRAVFIIFRLHAIAPARSNAGRSLAPGGSG